MASTVKKNQKADVPTKNGGKYSYQYVDIAQIHEYLEENGLSYYQYIDRIDGDDYIMTVRIIDGEAETIPLRGARVVDATLYGNENPAQKQGSALTYARRYSLLMAFGLATEDDDGASLNKEVEEKEPTEEDAINWQFTKSYKKHAEEKMIDVLQSDRQYVEWYMREKASEYDKKCYKLLTGEEIPSEESQDERIQLIAEMHELEMNTDTDHEKMLEHFKVESENQLTNVNIKEAIQILKKKEERKLLEKAINEE